jgi:hypothetical protein
MQLFFYKFAKEINPGKVNSYGSKTVTNNNKQEDIIKNFCCSLDIAWLQNLINQNFLKVQTKSVNSVKCYRSWIVTKTDTTDM